MLITILRIAGSLGLFVYGMRLLSDSLQRAAGDSLQRILNRLTGNRFSALLSGLFLTVLVQSSSASTVMIISFVNASLLSLVQAVGMIMGANIGTTLTGWIVAIFGFQVDVSSAALPAIGIGSALVFGKKLRGKAMGEALVGFGILFLGLMYLRDSVPDIQDHPELLETIGRLSDLGFLSTLIFVGVGTVLTIAVQSSSAAIAITLTMAYSGWIDFPTAAAIVLGENIGTTITANIAAFAGRTEARRAARAHILFNVAGVAWMIVVLPYALELVTFIVPAPAGDPLGVLPTRLAVFHTLFNVVNSALWIGFVDLLVKAAERIVPAAPKVERAPSDLPEAPYRAPVDPRDIGRAPELYLVEIRKELVSMSRHVGRMLGQVSEILEEDDPAVVQSSFDWMERWEDYIDGVREELQRLLAAFSMEALSRHGAAAVSAYMRCVNELERVADACYVLARELEKVSRKKWSFHNKARKGLVSCARMAQELYDLAVSSLYPSTRLELEAGRLRRRQLDERREELRKEARKRIQKDGHLKSELSFIDFLSEFEHVAGYSVNIMEAMEPVKREEHPGGQP